MIPRSIWLSLGFLCAGLVTTALADGDVATGRKLAQEHCSRCHDISPNAPFKLVPPSLRSIAVFRPADQIVTTHPLGTPRFDRFGRVQARVARMTSKGFAPLSRAVSIVVRTSASAFAAHMAR